MRQTVRSGIFASIAILFLILDTKTAISGMQAGLALCINAVIPSLFPFFILTSILTSALTGLPSAILRPVEKICRMSKGTGILLVTGLVGGYPTGAQSVAETYQRKQISIKNARRMLGFCSNAGPSFLFGIVASHFSCSAAPWLLWGIHILSCIVTAAILPGDFQTDQINLSHNKTTVIGSVECAGKNIAKVCLWILVFQVILAFLDRWFLWLLDPAAQVIICGLLELTAGCTSLSIITCEGLRFIICSVLLGFGGICVTMQTGSVIGGLGLTSYIKGKVIQCLVSLTLAVFLQHILFRGYDQVTIPTTFYVLFAVIVLICLIMKQKKKNRYSIIAKSGV